MERTTANVSTKSEINDLLNQLQKQVESCKSYTTNISHYANRLKNLPPLTEETNTEPKKLEESIVGYLQAELNRVNKLSQELAFIDNHLSTIIEK